MELENILPKKLKNLKKKRSKMEFLAKNYKLPVSGGDYTRFTQGDNQLRILGSAIVGTEAWTQKIGGKPVRKPMGEPFEVAEIDPETIKHFWAFPVWNYQTEKVEICEITQKGIMKAIKELTQDEDWGDPSQYDIVINRIGEGKETEYSVRTKPKKELKKEIKEDFEKMTIDLTQLYSSGDPFGINNQPAVKDDFLMDAGDL